MKYKLFINGFWKTFSVENFINSSPIFNNILGDYEIVNSYEDANICLYSFFLSLSELKFYKNIPHLFYIEENFYCTPRRRDAISIFSKLPNVFLFGLVKDSERSLYMTPEYAFKYLFTMLMNAETYKQMYPFESRKRKGCYLYSKSYNYRDRLLNVFNADNIRDICGHNNFIDKISDYSKHYSYYLAFENSLSPDDNYFTEKIINAVSGGNIPVYYGVYNLPECSLLNPDRIIILNKHNIDKIDSLCNKELFNLPILKSDHLIVYKKHVNHCIKRLNEFMNKFNCLQN